MRLLTEKEQADYEKKMQECIEHKGIIQSAEVESHLEADSLLCEILNKMGYKKITKLFENVNKWYE